MPISTHSGGGLTPSERALLVELSEAVKRIEQRLDRHEKILTSIKDAMLKVA